MKNQSPECLFETSFYRWLLTGEDVFVILFQPVEKPHQQQQLPPVRWFTTNGVPEDGVRLGKAQHLTALDFGLDTTANMHAGLTTNREVRFAQQLAQESLGCWCKEECLVLHFA